MTQKIDELIGSTHTRWWRRPLPWIVLALVLVAAGGAWWWTGKQQDAATPRYATETVGNGDLTLTVTANGKLQATRTVNIGSELSGTVRTVYVDVNDRVREGQVLVELDTAKLTAQVARSRASLASARARLAQAEATVAEARANLERLEEVARLSGGKVPSATELDASRAVLARAHAEENSARANVDDSKAALSTDETNLSKASVKSPIDGVVLSRSVEPGNAVAASLQAVTLFSLAEDLTRLVVEVSVDEADVGSVEVGQSAAFTVSAWPQRQYPATVGRVAFGSTLTENVVTYATRLEVDNTDLSLRPGMTVSASIIAAERRNVLLVPNAALRFSPLAAGAAAARPQASGGSPLMSRLVMQRPSRPGRSARTETRTAGAAQVWVLEDGAPQPVAVRTGITDGRMTEITGGGLQPGMAVIVDQLSAGARP